MRILVAGGAGYIGSSLVPRLLGRGYEVDVVDQLWFGNFLPSEAGLIQRDLMSLQASDLDGYEHVIFLAGLSNDPMAEYSPRRNFVENAAGPAYLAYTAKQAGAKRFIHGGSCSVYGYTVNKLYDEDSPTVCAYPYGISKLQGEFSGMQLEDESFSVIGFRKGTVSGYSPRMRFDLIVNTMFKCAVVDKMITVNNPAIWRPILAIEDAVSAYVRAVEAPLEISGIFNVASGNFTVGEVADYVQQGVKEHLGIEAKMTIKHMQDFRNYKVSFEKAQNVLSFKPRYDVEKIVRDLAQHMDEYGDFTDERFYNIRKFKSLQEDS
ncbi:MAG: SDR family oxidoreductase [Planctomycetes bacterium]|nr:SDR family oxidoreductase [Planctomycetota bacterium]